MFVGDIGVKISIPGSIITNGVPGPLTGYTIGIVGRDRMGNVKQFNGTIGTIPLLDPAGNEVAAAQWWAYYQTVSASDVPSSGEWRYQLIITQSTSVNIASSIVTVIVYDRLATAGA